MEDGLREFIEKDCNSSCSGVLILVLMEDGLRDLGS